MTRCARQHDVAPFLLGALTPAEERDLMVHAAACPVCQTTLRDLCKLPDLLALVPRSAAELIERSRSVSPAAVQHSGAPS